MLKLVIESYKNQFKSAIRNLWDTGLMIYIYIIFIPVIWFFDLQQNVLFYYCALIPMLVGLALSRMYPNEMSKTLLLCPMNEEERKEYIKTGYLLRCTIPLVLYSAVNMVLVLLDKLPFVYFLLIMVIEILFITAVNIYRVPKAGTPYAMERKYDLPGNYEVWNVCMQFAGIISTVLFVTDIPQKGEIYDLADKGRIFDMVMMGLAVFIVFLLWLKIVRTYCKPVMEHAVSMELPIKSEKKQK
ncbi:MAG: hypothetical protein IJX66_11675 [Lachnospiraceae bacterium]|nr:hypothetical protein [Lachnospiraceae bacterium]